jgi:hypothetical protein
MPSANEQLLKRAIASLLQNLFKSLDDQTAKRWSTER